MFDLSYYSDSLVSRDEEHFEFAIGSHFIFCNCHKMEVREQTDKLSCTGCDGLYCAPLCHAMRCKSSMRQDKKNVIIVEVETETDNYEEEWVNRIPLFNRYGSEVFLEQKENNIYYLRGEEEALMAVGVTFDGNPNNIIAIDPSGGPYISVGLEIIKGYIIESIESTKEGFKIKFKEQ